jgi:alkylglycerol monooxygenase
LFGTFEPETIDVVYGVTHPQNTWDPVTIQFHHLYETWLAATKTPGLFNKIRTFIDRGPGYNYEVLYPEEVTNANGQGK